eukprot:1673288-Rhodomonas_salina.1
MSPAPLRCAARALVRSGACCQREATWMDVSGHVGSHVQARASKAAWNITMAEPPTSHSFSLPPSGSIPLPPPLPPSLPSFPALLPSLLP